MPLTLAGALTNQEVIAAFNHVRGSMDALAHNLFLELRPGLAGSHLVLPSLGGDDIQLKTKVWQHTVRLTNNRPDNEQRIYETAYNMITDIGSYGRGLVWHGGSSLVHLVADDGQIVRHSPLYDDYQITLRSIFVHEHQDAKKVSISLKKETFPPEWGEVCL